jgi:hypothetical protein
MQIADNNLFIHTADPDSVNRDETPIFPYMKLNLEKASV